MCDTCGCSQPADAVKIRKPGEEAHGHSHDHPHDHDHGHHHHHDHGHDHDHDHGSNRTIEIAQDVLFQNNMLAQRNRGWFEAKNLLTLNLVSSPGSGKTSVLERTITDLKDELTICVIEGDQQTLNDADRIDATGAAVVQVNTGKGCHLDAEMIHKAVHKLEPAEGSILMVENVGNLVCPALFDLGEEAKVVIISTTEGDDKPAKYPNMFAASSLCLINKIDLLPYVNFDMEACEKAALQVNPNLEFIHVSATSGEGMDQWYDWLKAKRSR